MKVATIPLLILALAACGHIAVAVPEAEKAFQEPSSVPTKTAPKPTDPSAREAAAIQSALQLVQSGKAAYTISPADLIEISVYKEADMDRKVRVSPDGVITFPLAGSVKVGGLDVPHAEAAITEQLKKYLINPQVSVFIKEYGNKIIYVLGEVQKPGSYPIPTEARLSVLEAVTLAGGFTQYAAQDRTRIIRKKAGQSEVLTVEVSAITKRGDKSQDLPLEPNDVVFVPESLF